MDPSNNRFFREAGDDEWYFIWSHEHAAWWASAGYTKSMTEARVFSRKQALAICTAALPGTAARMGTMPELPVRKEDAFALLDRYRGTFPDRAAEAWQ